MNQVYRQRYQLELAEKTTRWGWLIAVIAALSIVYFYYADVNALYLEGTLPWRLIGLLGPVLYLLARGIPVLRKYESLAYGLMFLLIITMMSGIAVLIFANPASEDSHLSAIAIGNTTVWVLTAILAMGGRGLILRVGSIILLLTIVACSLLMNDPTWMPYLLTIILTGGLGLLVLYTQARYDRERAYSVYELEASRDKVHQQAEDLQLANDNLLTFTRAMSHDLQSPLRSVRSFLDLYQKRSKDRLPSDTQEYLDLAVSYLKQGQEVVTSLLTYSKIGKDPITKKPVRLEALFKRIITELTEARDVPLIHYFDVQLEEKIISADQQLLWHAFSNLMSNAVKFSQSQEEPLVVVNSRREGDEVIVTISDNGVGFDEAFSEELGRPFVRLHGTEFSGTGIGLSVVRQVMELHDGRFWAESKHGEGASFSCAFPQVK